MTKTQLPSLISLAILGSFFPAACGKEQVTICTDQGTQYEIGQSFKRDCNTCTCTAEGISCTLIGCLPSTGGATTHTGGAGGVPGSGGGTAGIAGSTGAGGTAGSSDTGGSIGTGGANPNPDAAAQGCIEGGLSYHIGETFKRDCNTCTCTANGPICTEKACPVDAASDLPQTCSLGGREYHIGETFKSDCNTCECTSNGIACTAAICFHDAGTDLPRAVDGNSACALSASLTFGHDGGYVAYWDVNRLTATSFTITRNYSQRTGRDGATTASCSPTLPACGTTGTVTVATINADLADPDVQGVWGLPQDPIPIFGTDPRPVDGSVYSIALDDGHKVLVGGQCASPAMSSCRYIPAGLLQLTQDLQSLAAAMMADPACKGAF